MRRLAFVALVAFALVIASSVNAKPSHSTLADIDADASTVAVVRFVGPTTPNAPAYDLTIERVLRGGGAPGGKLHVKASPDGHAYFAGGDRLIAFVDANGTWLAYAKLLAGPTLEDGVLWLEGFDDFDAHLVSPGFVTLSQLEAFVVRHVPLAWTFRGKLLLATASGLVPSSIDVTALAPSNLVTGMPVMAGFPAPTVGVGSWSDSVVTVTWSQNLARPFALRGEAVGKNPDGSIAVEFRLEHPELLTEADLRNYLANPKLGHPYYLLRVELGATSVPVVLHQKIGDIGTIGDAEITEGESSPGRFLRGLGVRVTLASTGFHARSSSTVDAFVEELITGPVACTYTTGAGASPCRLRLVETKFASP